MARRKHRRNPRAKYKVRHVVLKKNPRRRRRNPEGGFGETGELLPLAAGTKIPAAVAAEAPIGPMFGPARPPRGYRKQQRASEVKRLRGLAKKARKGAKGRGVAAMAKRAQAVRLEAIAAVLAKRGRAVHKSPLIKAMSVRANPSMEDVKILGMQAVAATGGFVGMAAIGKMVSDLILMEKKDGVSALKADYVKDGKRTAVAKYAPAAGTLVATVAGLALLAGKSKYVIGLTIGGMSAAILQAVLATDNVPVEPAKDAPLADKVKSYLGLGEYTAVGGGIFHGVGEYTTVGQAHPFRPRNYGDDQMQWAATGGLGAMLEDRGGADNRSEFAPGEGGIFSKTPLLSR